MPTGKENTPSFTHSFDGLSGCRQLTPHLYLLNADHFKHQVADKNYTKSSKVATAAAA